MAQLVIEYTRDGRLQVHSPPDKMLAVGMLEMAKHVIVSQQPAEQKRVVVPAPVIPSIAKGG